MRATARRKGKKRSKALDEVDGDEIEPGRREFIYIIVVIQAYGCRAAETVLGPAAISTVFAERHS